VLCGTLANNCPSKTDTSVNSLLQVDQVFLKADEAQAILAATHFHAENAPIALYLEAMI